MIIILINNKRMMLQRRWLNNYNIRIRTLIGSELKRRKNMDAFYWMMGKTKHIPEHGTYSSASLHRHFMLLNILICLHYIFTL